MAAPNSRSTLIEYCLRKLGKPVIEINVEQTQIDDRVDEALEYYQEFHSDATIRTYLKHVVTSTDITNRYIDVPESIIFVTKLFPLSGSYLTQGMFSWKYQFHLNDMANLHGFMGDIAYYHQMQQYLELIDMELNGTPQVTFSRRENRLYIHGDFNDQDILEGDYIIAEVYQIVDPDTNTSIYNDMFIKEYTTALLKHQWGQNMSKFEGMQLPGGVTISGKEILAEAKIELDTLRERARLEQELPADFFIG